MFESPEYFYVIVDEWTGVEIDTHWHDEDNVYPFGMWYVSEDVRGEVVKIVHESTYTRRVFIREPV